MKSIRWILPLVAVLMAAVSCGPKAKAPKVLVLYYSQTSNTKTVAEAIQDKLGADIEEIVPVVPYDGDFQATIERSGRERNEGVLPEIEPLKVDVADYDIIFLGYPIWFGTYAPPVGALLEKVDLSGKKVVPFCTFGSGGLFSSIEDLKKKCPDAEILPGYGVRAARISAVPKEVENFLKAGGFIEGEAIQLEDFPEPHPATEEEAAIFAAAVSDYPMMTNAVASTATSRVIPGGVEYLFTAVTAPANPDGLKGPGAPDGPKGPGAPGGFKAPAGDRPNLPPPGDMKVYVTVEDGQAPVFTQVLR